MYKVIELKSEKDFILFKEFLESINVGSDYYDLPLIIKKMTMKIL